MTGWTKGILFIQSRSSELNAAMEQRIGLDPLIHCCSRFLFKNRSDDETIVLLRKI